MTLQEIYTSTKCLEFGESLLKQAPFYKRLFDTFYDK